MSISDDDSTVRVVWVLMLYWLDADVLARCGDEALDIMRRRDVVLLVRCLDVFDASGVEDEDLSVFWASEVVGDFIYEDEITRLGVSFEDFGASRDLV